MDNEFMNRGYLLPPGCKDLSDALKVKHKQLPSLYQFLPKHPIGHDTTWKNWNPPASLPPVKGQIFISPHTTVSKLAALLDLEEARINSDLTKVGILAFPDSVLDFETISKVARMHGFMAIKSA